MEEEKKELISAILRKRIGDCNFCDVFCSKIVKFLDTSEEVVLNNLLFDLSRRAPKERVAEVEDIVRKHYLADGIYFFIEPALIEISRVFHVKIEHQKRWSYDRYDNGEHSSDWEVWHGSRWI